MRKITTKCFAIKFLLPCLTLLMWHLDTMATVAFIPDDFAPYDFPDTWSGYGDVNLSQTNCIASYVGGGGGGPNGVQGRDYRLRISMNSPGTSPNDPYEMLNSLDNSIRLPFSILVTDLHGGGTNTLSPDIFLNNLTYNPFCTLDPAQGPNIELSVSITEAQLRQVPAGNYSVDLLVRAQRGFFGNDYHEQTLTASISIPKLVQVNNVNDINLGTYNGVASELAFNEPFCVYSNDDGDYQITPSTSTTITGEPTSFAMISGTDELRYTVQLEDSADASGGEEILNNNPPSTVFNTGQSIPYSTSCDGGDNAAVYIRIDGSDLQTAPAGSYSGTLNLRVDPI